MNRLLSMNVWVGVSCALAVVGILLAVMGTMNNVAWVRTTGLLLISPVVLLGALLVLVGFPLLILANRRHARPSNSKYDANGPRDDAQKQ